MRLWDNIFYRIAFTCLSGVLSYWAVNSQRPDTPFFSLPQCLLGYLACNRWQSVHICWLTKWRVLYQLSLCVLLPGMVMGFYWSTFWLHTVISKVNSSLSLATPYPSSIPARRRGLDMSQEQNRIPRHSWLLHWGCASRGRIGDGVHTLGSLSLHSPPLAVACSSSAGVMRWALVPPSSPSSGPSCDHQWWAVTCNHPVPKGSHQPL